MRKLKLGFFVFIGLLACTSSSDDKNSIELSSKEILVQNSPWTYDRYELIEIVSEAIGGNTEEKAKNNADSDNDGNILTFNENGTGSSSSTGGSNNWQWEITNDNKLKLIYSAQEEYVYDFSITVEELTIKVYDEIDATGRVYGNYIFK